MTSFLLCLTLITSMSGAGSCYIAQLIAGADLTLSAITSTSVPCRFFGNFMYHNVSNTAMTMQAPARLIANNAGVEGDVIVEKVFGKSWDLGYNAMDDRIENLLEAGIIDPAKVSFVLLTEVSSKHT